jgi:dTDP-4-dehydrorhamnose 3,5-epimerase
VCHAHDVVRITNSEVIEGIVVCEPQVFRDERGQFVESYRQEWIPGSAPMVQGNRADRQRGCLVGLHYHLHQADYWYVPAGRAHMVLHDLRRSTSTRGKSLSMELDGDEHRGVYIPPGVAHGFYALTDLTITYLVDRYYDPADELGVAWDDPTLGVDWPSDAPILSGRDRENPRRADIPVEIQPA